MFMLGLIAGSFSQKKTPNLDAIPVQNISTLKSTTCTGIILLHTNLNYPVFMTCFCYSPMLIMEDNFTAELHALC